MRTRGTIHVTNVENKTRIRKYQTNNCFENVKKENKLLIGSSDRFTQSALCNQQNLTRRNVAQRMKVAVNMCDSVEHFDGNEEIQGKRDHLEVSMNTVNTKIDRMDYRCVNDVYDEVVKEGDRGDSIEKIRWRNWHDSLISGRDECLCVVCQNDEELFLPREISDYVSREGFRKETKLYIDDFPADIVSLYFYGCLEIANGNEILLDELISEEIILPLYVLASKYLSIPWKDVLERKIRLLPLLDYNLDELFHLIRFLEQYDFLEDQHFVCNISHLDEITSRHLFTIQNNSDHLQEYQTLPLSFRMNVSKRQQHQFTELFDQIRILQSASMDAKSFSKHLEKLWTSHGLVAPSSSTTIFNHVNKNRCTRVSG